MTLDLAARLDDRCPDCGAGPGYKHLLGCDVERCPLCGEQLIGCGCDSETIIRFGRLEWSGEWPGWQNARDLGWFCKWDRISGGWVECDSDDPEAVPDLNRLSTDGVWIKDDKKYVVR